MKLTKEEIEQAKGLIWTCARTNNPSKAELRICLRELDTLCAAASEPESLVGQRVRIKHGPLQRPGYLGTVTKHNVPQQEGTYIVTFDDAAWCEYAGDDFEPLEGK